MPPSNHLRAIRLWLAVVIAGLVLSGVTAFPLETELRGVHSLLETTALRPIAESTRLLPWIARVHGALSSTNEHYPFLAYGTDWLAFAHLVIAVAFVGPYRDPVRNKWIITFGLIACGGVIPLALIAGHIRGIPIAWRCIDCSFGIFGAIPLLLCRGHILALEQIDAEEQISSDRCTRKARTPWRRQLFVHTSHPHFVAIPSLHPLD